MLERRGGMLNFEISWSTSSQQSRLVFVKCWFRSWLQLHVQSASYIRCSSLIVEPSSTSFIRKTQGECFRHIFFFASIYNADIAPYPVLCEETSSSSTASDIHSLELNLNTKGDMIPVLKSPAPFFVSSRRICRRNMHPTG